VGNWARVGPRAWPCWRKGYIRAGDCRPASYPASVSRSRSHGRTSLPGPGQLSLRGYALANRNYADAAARLHLHPVRYRIDRLGELFGLNVDDAGTFARVVIQSHRPMPD